ncbi:hypothetical protein [Streptomyces somaliensis]|uniref:hypothetical protein n=1 Tax=Streptomyces somaliensis TaxID=78355 RepID=UPI0034E97A41
MVWHFLMATTSWAAGRRGRRRRPAGRGGSGTAAGLTLTDEDRKRLANLGGNLAAGRPA